MSTSREFASFSKSAGGTSSASTRNSNESRSRPPTRRSPSSAGAKGSGSSPAFPRANTTSRRAKKCSTTRLHTSSPSETRSGSYNAPASSSATAASCMLRSFIGGRDSSAASSSRRRSNILGEARLDASSTTAPSSSRKAAESMRPQRPRCRPWRIASGFDSRPTPWGTRIARDGSNGRSTTSKTTSTRVAPSPISRTATRSSGPGVIDQI